jgi:signal transduction histidine kinase
MIKHSTITIRETKESKMVKIGSDLKPKIAQGVIDKWQSLIDTVAKIADVPSGLIMRLNEKTIEVFLTSETEGNPYKVGEQANLIYGLYCETVIGTQKKLLVPDATKNKSWKENNPDVDIDMISYLGFPINWPDGEVFGTVCVLDNKENYYSNDLSNLLHQIKQHIETDLQILLLNTDLVEKNSQLEQLNNTKSKFLSLISHDIRGSVGTLSEFLKLILEDYDRFDKSELKPILNSLSKNAISTYQTLETLLTWSKNDLVQIKPNKIKVNIVDITETILNSFEQTIILKELKIEKEYYSNNVFISVDEKMMIVIIRNILSNAIKYTKRGGTITIRMFQFKKQEIIEIEDTGIGMDKSSVDNLFSYDESHSTQGTKGESSAGIGLMLANEFMVKNDIKVIVESEIGKGTIFKLSI